MPVLEDKTISTSYVNNNGKSFANLYYDDRVRNINFNKLFTFPSSKLTLHDKLTKLLKSKKSKKKYKKKSKKKSRKKSKKKSKKSKKYRK